MAGEVTEKQQELLGRISEKIKGLSDLAAELLDLLKIESGLITLEKEKLHVASLLSEQVAFHQTRAQGKNIQLTLESLPRIPPILANKRTIEEVFANLLTNAIKYTPESGQVSVSAEAERAGFASRRTRDRHFAGKPEQDLRTLLPGEGRQHAE